MSEEQELLDFGGCFPVFQQKTVSGFHQRVYVMYHGTPVANVEAILRDGFNSSKGTGCLLGGGIYVSKDMEKTFFYADRLGTPGVTFKMLVYPGKVKRITDPTDPAAKTWHGSHNSAWIPAGCNLAMIPSGREENCLKSRSQVRVLGVCRGFERLKRKVKEMTFDVTGTGTSLDSRERKALHTMLVEEGILYCHVAHIESERFLQRITAPDGQAMAVLEAFSGGEVGQLWTRSWDLCLESKEDGSVLEIGPGERLLCSRVVDGGPAQNLRIDNSGKLFNKPRQRTIVSLGGGPDLVAKRYDRKDDKWKFVSFDDHWTLP